MKTSSLLCYAVPLDNNKHNERASNKTEQVKQQLITRGYATGSRPGVQSASLIMTSLVTS